VVEWWKEMETAAICAVLNPGEKFTARNARFVMQKSWLFMVLPSGRALCYPGAKVEDGKLSYMGMNQWTRKWVRIATHGGKLAENFTQAFARDVLASSMQHIEDDGYPIVLSVHDELLTEPPARPDYTVDRLVARMATPPDYAPDLPLAAAGYESDRYKKE
jgi:DNA polymerase